MVGGGRKKTEASSSSSVSDEAAAGDKAPSDRDHQHDEEAKAQEESPSQAGEEEKGEEEGEEEGEEGEEEIDGERVSDEEEEEDGDGGEEAEGEAEGKLKLDEGFYEIEAIRRKRYRKGQLQYLIKWRGYPETDNTWEPYDNIKYCADMVEAFDESLRKRKRKRKGPLTKRRRSMQSEDGGDGIMTLTGRDDSSPRSPSSSKRGKGRSRGQAHTTERDMTVLKRNPRRNINSHDKKEKNSKDKKGKERPSKDEAMTNEQAVEGMNKGEGANFVMTDNIQKAKENEAKAGGSISSMAIHLPNCNMEGHDDASLVPLPVGPMPSFYSHSQPQGSKASGQVTGAKKRKSGCVRRFVQPEEEAKKAIIAEVVDSTEAVAGPAAVNTATDSNSKKDKEQLHITKILKPVQLLASSSPATDNKQHVSVTFEALRSDGSHVFINNRELKATDPLLLIDFYEQHLRYSPDP